MAICQVAVLTLTIPFLISSLHTAAAVTPGTSSNLFAGTSEGYVDSQQPPSVSLLTLNRPLHRSKGDSNPSRSESMPTDIPTPLASVNHRPSSTAYLSLANSESGYSGSAKVDHREESGFLRWRPKGIMAELGVFGGAFWLNSKHQFFGGRKDSDSTRWRRYPHVIPEVGIRAAIYPAGFIGVEVEGSLLPTQAKAEPSLNLGKADALFWTARGHVVLQIPAANLVPFALIGAGAMGVESPKGSGQDADAAIHFGGGLKYYFSKFVGIRVDVRDVVMNRRGEQDKFRSHNLEVLGSLMLTFGRKDPPPPPPPPPPPAPVPPADADGDGILDKDDQCPQDAELLNGFEDEDGCPESDRDGDGFWDKPNKDACPDEIGVAPDGCPIRDTDGDGIDDPQDQCPDEAETRNGFEDEDGCPDEVPKEEVAKFSGTIPGIKFETGNAVIKPQSESILNLTVELLRKYPTLQLEIVGHTDSVGSDAANMALSQARADAVRVYIVNAGIEANRLTTRGAGESEPIANNRKKSGRAQNRRIDFKITEN